MNEQVAPCCQGGRELKIFRTDSGGNNRKKNRPKKRDCEGEAGKKNKGKKKFIDVDFRLSLI